MKTVKQIDSKKVINLIEKRVKQDAKVGKGSGKALYWVDPETHFTWVSDSHICVRLSEGFIFPEDKWWCWERFKNFIAGIDQKHFVDISITNVILDLGDSKVRLFKNQEAFTWLDEVYNPIFDIDNSLTFIIPSEKFKTLYVKDSIGLVAVIAPIRPDPKFEPYTDIQAVAKMINGEVG